MRASKGVDGSRPGLIRTGFAPRRRTAQLVNSQAGNPPRSGPVMATMGRLATCLVHASRAPRGLGIARSVGVEIPQVGLDPPVRRGDRGLPRTVGVEIELTGLDVSAISNTVADLFDGR